MQRRDGVDGTEREMPEEICGKVRELRVLSEEVLEWLRAEISEEDVVEFVI